MTSLNQNSPDLWIKWHEAWFIDVEFGSDGSQATTMRFSFLLVATIITCAITVLVIFYAYASVDQPSSHQPGVLQMPH